MERAKATFATLYPIPCSYIFGYICSDSNLCYIYSRQLTLGPLFSRKSHRYSISCWAVMISIIGGKAICFRSNSTLIIASSGHGPFEFWVTMGVLAAPFHFTHLRWYSCDRFTNWAGEPEGEALRRIVAPPLLHGTTDSDLSSELVEMVTSSMSEKGWKNDRMNERMNTQGMNHASNQLTFILWFFIKG